MEININKPKYEKIIAYKTTDGEFYEKEQDAIEHQNYLDAIIELDDLLDDYGYSFKEDIKDLILDNKERLKNILKNLGV